MTINYNYMKQCLITASGKFYGSYIKTDLFLNIAKDCIKNINRLDNAKKQIFYGRDLPNLVMDRSQSLDDFAYNEKNQRILHGVIGIATEGGELLEALVDALGDKASSSIDEINIQEEVGDILWYVAILLDAIDSDFEECQKINILKLRKRYGDKFSSFDANNRDLAAERQILEKHNDNDMHITEQVVKFLCEKSHHPHDDFDVLAQKLGGFADKYLGTLSASEAVYGFAAWLTTRKDVTEFGSDKDCAPIVQLVVEFCDTNSFDDPRDDFDSILIHPKNDTAQVVEQPVQGSAWKHTNGTLYRVEEPANVDGDRPAYLEHVNYRNVINGKLYTRELSDWYRSMTKVEG